jgi:hypothetical protein
MAFLYYQREKGKLKKTGQSFSLAGYNLIYQLWELNGSPTDQGWHISANDLIKRYSNENDSHTSAAMLIDFDPSSKWRIGIIEILDIYLYTYSGTTREKSGWSPMMLRFRNVMYEEYDDELREDKKNKILESINDTHSSEDFVEFLYLNGSDKGWNWGRNGMTNAAFIEGPARDYFRKYF